MPIDVSRWACGALVALSGIAPCHADDTGLLRTAYALDDVRGYCIDIAGAGATIRLDDPLQAHTCKYGGSLDDQLIAHQADGSMIRLPQYRRCLAAAALEPGAALHARACEDSEAQSWRFAWGRLSPESRPDLCVTLADGAGQVTGTPAMITPVYRRRDLTLARCDAAADERQTLRFSPRDERSLSTADTIRLGMPADVAERLAAFGREFDGEIAAQTNAILAPVATIYEPAEIEVAAGIAYGSHPLQQLDVHTATVRNSAQPMAAIVLFHGGGLVGGDKRATIAAANYLASLGYIGINANYRLATDHPWPDGARDVGAAVTWAHQHVAEYGGDPEQIFVMGLSSGSLHAATYVFRPELMPAGTHRAAGAILMSGPYTFDFEHPSVGELAYFGNDPDEYARRVVVGNVSDATMPVLFTTAEWDAPRYTRAFSELLHELVVEHGVMPRYAQSLGHNHSSQLMMLGTAETSVAAEIVDFLEQTVRVR